MRRAILVGLALSVLGGCDAGLQSQQVVEEVSLGGLADCAQLRNQLQDQAAREMNAELDGTIASLDDSEGDAYRAGGATPTAPPAPSPSPAEGASDYTTTNTQEKDVDEPDFVKNDGSRIFALHGRRLLTLAAWPPTSARIESDTALEGEPISMLLHRDRLVVLSAVWLAGLGGWDDPGLPTPYIERSARNAVRVAVMDVADGVPHLLDSQYLEGSFLNARRTGAMVRIVSLAGPRGPKLSYWPQGGQRSRAALRAALEQLRDENLRRIKAATLADWLPRILRPNGAGELVEVERECSSYLASNVPARLGFTTISSLDLDSLTTRHSTLLNAADEVYASSRALYLAARHEWPSRFSQTSSREDHTYLFQFDLASDPGALRYVASGGVPGHIADQFSLDEEAGYLRVATTRQTWRGWQQLSSTNGVYVLRASAGRLQRVGEIVGLAPGEQLYAARFEGPRGYLVTFRQVDPLFTLDLSAASDPRVAGELHVPGFSTYLHPIDPTHLLTIGRDVSEDGRFMRGLQLQIFDVSNFASPALRHRYLLGNRSSSSEAEYDHKAFNYFASRGLLAVPFSDWSASRGFAFVSTLEVLRATPELGITSLGSIDHADLLQGTAGPRVPGWTPQVRRSVMMDDYVYSISFGGTKVHDTRDLSRAVRTIPFPELE